MTCLSWPKRSLAAVLPMLVACTGQTLGLEEDALRGAEVSRDAGATGAASDGSAKSSRPEFPPNSGVAPAVSCTGGVDAQGFGTVRAGTVAHRYRLPTSYRAASPAPTPLLVVLHGCGDSAANAAGWIGAPWALRPDGISHMVLGVGGRDGACWGDDNALVLDAIEALAQCAFVDRRRVVLAGFSSGGELGFRLMYARGAAFAGLLVEHSGLMQAFPNEDLKQRTSAPPWAFPVAWVAGRNDSVFPIAQARTEMDLLRRAGHPLRAFETDDAHDGKSDPNWKDTLLPAMQGWQTPLPAR